MPQKVLRFSGINRRVNEFNSTGSCEEMINLRPEALGGYRAVKDKLTFKQSGNLKYIYEHKFGNINNIITFDAGYINWIEENGREHAITDKFRGMGDITFSSAGNVLVIYSETNKKQLVYKFEDNQYKSYSISIPAISNCYFSEEGIAMHSVQADQKTESGLNTALLKAASSISEKFNEGFCGIVVVGCTYELESGEEIWSTGFHIIESISISEDDLNNSIATVTGTKRGYFNFDIGSTNTKNVNKINIYASRPIVPYEVESYIVSSGSSNSGEPIRQEKFRTKRLSADALMLGGQLMYYQTSVSVTKENNHASVLLDFSKDKSGDQLMPVTAGCIDRIGKTVSYNNRFHCFRSDVSHIIQTPCVKNRPAANAPKWRAYIKYDKKWYRTKYVIQTRTDVMNSFVYPLNDITRMAFVQVLENNPDWSNNTMFYVDMQNSSAYNYSYAIDVTPDVITASDFYYSLLESGESVSGYDEKIFLKEEPNAINVSSQYNPFVFPVEYSYSFGGKIIDIVTSYLPISSTQVGQYPLTVFTSNGIYALEQGNGNVLYSNTSPLNPMILSGKAAATPYGTFFVSSNGLYMLSGRDTANVSYVLDGEREENLRELDAYKRLCNNTKGQFEDFGKFISNEDFENFISNASLVYDQLNNELIISTYDDTINYSYVFNLDTRSFHKISKRLLGNQNGARYAIERKDDDISIVDLQKEVHNNSKPILIQSRPVQLEALSTHIQRMILYVDTKLNGDKQNLCFSVFGSDNLYDWKCIISAQKQNTVLRHIRTNKAAKSYKDYIILITGTVDTHTDLSDIIADYTVVNRRLG